MLRPLLVLLALLLTTPARSQFVVATIDLSTPEGVAAVEGEWRYSDVRLVQVPAVNAKGEAVVTHDFEPKAGAADFDDSAWEAVHPFALFEQRGNGRVSFGWYRIRVTIPEIEPGSAVWFETVVDDYAEIWVNGQLPREVGQRGGSMVAGFNAPNRVLLTQNAVAGQQFQIAIFAMNGPISDAPPNFIFIRSAKLELVKPARRRSVR